MVRDWPIGVMPLEGLPLFAPGMDLAAELRAASDCAGLDLRDGDVLVVAQKGVSKVEGFACPASLPAKRRRTLPPAPGAAPNWRS